jgi:hypothetical protein
MTYAEEGLEQVLKYRNKYSLIYTANRHACIIIGICTCTTIRILPFTNFMTDSKARLNFTNWYIRAVHTAARKPTFRITGDGLQKIPR